MDIDWIIDGGYLPHALIRVGIRRQLAQRLASLHPQGATPSERLAFKMAFIANLRTLPIAVETDAANSQHYEVGAGVLEGCLGPRMKYSCCLYEKGGETLAQAEVAMLKSYMVKAELKDGMSILDLGCGWGSGAIFFAEMMPNSSITAFSNSKTQKEYIDAVAKEKGLKNVKVVTGNVVDYEFEASSFDRVVSIELFEHMKNLNLLMAKISRALKPGGKLFVHTFAHHSTPYDYEADARDGGWMARHFFTGGTMPSADLLLYFQPGGLSVVNHWWLNGSHYAKTCEDWLICMLRNKEKIWPDLVKTYGGEEEAQKWWQRWQVFYLACAELFAYDGGETWGVVHYLFEKA